MRLGRRGRDSQMLSFEFEALEVKVDIDHFIGIFIIYVYSAIKIKFDQ